MRRSVALVTALVIAMLMPNPELRAQSNQQRTRYFCGTGRVVSVDEDRLGVTIAHQTIEGFMPAMTMHFKADDSATLSDVSAGERVRFTLKDTPELTRLIYIENVAPEARQRRKR